jgi:hypothetical protein
VKYEQAQQALRMVLEDTTLEEARWALGQVQGFCHLSLRPNQDGETLALLKYMIMSSLCSNTVWLK